MADFEFTNHTIKFTIPDQYHSIFNITSNKKLEYESLDQEYRKLLLLVDEELALWNEDELLVEIKYPNIYQLAREEMDILGLPEFYPFALDLNLPNSITDPEFHILVNYKKPSGELIVKPTVKGGYVKISNDEEYLLDENSYLLLENVRYFNEYKEQLSKPKELKILAQIIDDLKNANRNVPTEFEEYEIVPMEKFSVNLEEEQDGTLSVLPVPLAEDTEIDKNDPELKERKIPKEALTDDEQQRFQRQFKKKDGIPSQFRLRGRKLLVYDRELFDGQNDNHKNDILSQFKELQKLKGKEKKQFVEKPGSFLNAEFVDLTDLSERVREIGQYQPAVLPYVPKTDSEWFPDEGGIIIDGERIRVEPESRKELIDEIKKAINDGRNEVEYENRTYPATEDTLEALEKLKASETSGSFRQDKNEKDAFDKDDPNNTILIIKDNYFDVDGTFKPNSARNGKIGLPNSLATETKLFSYQEDGLKWMQKLWLKGEKGGLLADDMGLGKTLQALTFAAWVKEQSPSDKDQGPVLVAAPLTLLENWCNEYDKFLDRSIFGEPLKLHGAVLSQYKKDGLDISHERDIDEDTHDIDELINKRGGLLLDIVALKKVDLIITTYEAIRDYQFSFSRINWSVMILDEIQKIKNPETLVSKAVKAMNYEFGLGLTGTPVENSWNELWSIMDFVQPGHLGSLSHFNENYQKKLEDPKVNQEELGLKLKKELGDLVRRRLKGDHLDGLPERVVLDKQVELSDYQKQRYSEVLDEAKSSDSDRHILTLLAALRDISLCPYLPYKHEQKILDMPGQEIVKNSAKVKLVFELLDKIKNRSEKAIIFLISRKMQTVLQKLTIEHYGLRPYIINGTVSGGRRQKLVDKFQESDGFNVIIMSPAAAGVGLNVTAANHVIHLSRPWNPAKEDQASDRVYRIGQEKKVTIYIPISNFPALGKGKSFDEKLHKLLESKRNLSKSVLLPAKIDKSELMSLETGMLTNGSTTELERTLELTDIDDLTGNEFEKFCSKLLKKQGYTVKLTPVNDQGADVIAYLPKEKKGILIQCKSKLDPNKKISNKAVQEVTGAKLYYENIYSGYSFDLSVITNAKNFTNSARALAQSNNVTLWDRVYLNDAIKEYQMTLGALAV